MRGYCQKLTSAEVLLIFARFSSEMARASRKSDSVF